MIAFRRVRLNDNDDAPFPSLRSASSRVEGGGDSEVEVRAEGEAAPQSHVKNFHPLEAHLIGCPWVRGLTVLASVNAYLAYHRYQRIAKKV